MIKMVLKRFDRTVELNVPAEYEHVLLCLWRLGLDRDPAKYTIRQLEAVFSYDTPEEHQMIRLIDAGDTLLDALVLLHQMMVPPYPIAVRVRAKILSGAYQSGVSFAADMDDLISKEAEYEAQFFFPIFGELVDKHGNAESAPALLMAEYEQMIENVLSRLQLQSLHSVPALFSDVDGAYQKLLSASWCVERLGNTLIGKLVLLLTDLLTEEEASDTAEKIEMIHSVDFAIRLKQWSVLTDQGLLFIRLCDENGDYSVILPDELDGLDDDNETDEPCLCPECQERLRRQAGTVPSEIDPEEYLYE